MFHKIIKLLGFQEVTGVMSPTMIGAIEMANA